MSLAPLTTTDTAMLATLRAAGLPGVMPAVAHKPVPAGEPLGHARWLV